MIKKNHPNQSRRQFIKNTSKSGALFFLSPPFIEKQNQTELFLPPKLQEVPAYMKALDLSPSKWIWYPGKRTLANTVILFRKKINLQYSVTSTHGWILGDSRYKLYVNGKYVQFGPAPSDPRFSEADYLDIGRFLRQGENTLAVEVLYFGHGDGTWPIGKPGFIFNLDITTADRQTTLIVSDESWLTTVAESWRPGQYKRWYLRALQENFDANKYPIHWMRNDFTPEKDQWTAAMPLNNPADKPAICSTYEDYSLQIQGDPEECQLRERCIPAMNEEDIPVFDLVESKLIKWRIQPELYFDMKTENAYELVGEADIVYMNPAGWQFTGDKETSTLLTFELNEQMVGFPYLVIETSKDTVIELMVQEGHIINQSDPLMNNHFNSWTRFICRQGENRFVTFDFESLRWIQLCIRNADGPILIREIGVRRRKYAWPNYPEISCSDPVIQKVLNASINTLNNSAHETIVDGMGRERQQYSGDVGHELHALFYTFGDTRLPARYVNTYSQGLTKDGFFLDCWPAYDRLARLVERQLNLTPWGPLLDHGIGFNFDCYNYYLYTGDFSALKEVFPRLVVFKNYIKNLVEDETGLLPVEDLGIPVVWMDTDSYQKQSHKQCAFNLYAAAMLKHAFIPLCQVLDDTINAGEAKELSERLQKSVMAHFYDPGRNTLIVNKPWLHDEGKIRMCERSLATAIMYDMIPEEGIGRSTEILANPPVELGRCYPANTGWGYWALAKGGKTDVILDDIRMRFGSMDSVNLNNTLQESWTVTADSNAQWSHCPVSPLYIFYMGIIGLRPLAAGLDKMEIWPQPGSLEEINAKAYTVKGEIVFVSKGVKGDRTITLMVPANMHSTLKLNAKEKVNLEEIASSDKKYRYYKLPGNEEIKIKLNHT